MISDPILSVKKLTTPLMINQVAYNVVDHLSFDLSLGQTLALVGESGSGKTMAALSLLKIQPKPPCLDVRGEVLYRGKNLLKMSEKAMQKIRGSKIAMIFQDPNTSLNPVYTIGNQLVEIANLHLQLFGDDAISRASAALEEVGIPLARERLYDYPHELSGGMQQRVMIAMALMCEPDILIADEPTTALDVTIQAQVLNLIKQLQKKRGMALLLITHDMGVVAEMADDVIVMYTSQAMETGSVFDIFDRMTHPYTMGLFSSLPSKKGKKEPLTPIKGTVPALEHYPEGCHFNTRCPYVMKKCLHGKVPDFPILSSKKHLSKCWLCE